MFYPIIVRSSSSSCPVGSSAVSQFSTFALNIQYIADYSVNLFLFFVGFLFFFDIAALFIRADQLASLFYHIAAALRAFLYGSDAAMT